MNIKRIAGILIIFGVILCACRANRDEVNISGLTVTSKDSSEGILLYIENIPEETMYLSVSLYDITTNDQLYTGASLKDNELEQIKKTGFLHCPFVKNGHEYEIIVSANILTEENMKPVGSASVTAAARGGIHIINNPALVWNKNDNIAVLSAKPVFSDDAVNSQNAELNYGLVFIGEESTNSMSGGKVNGGYVPLANELTVDNTQNFNALVEMIGNLGLSGDIPIFADVQLTLDYEDTKWTLTFAKTDLTLL